MARSFGAFGRLPQNGARWCCPMNEEDKQALWRRLDRLERVAAFTAGLVINCAAWGGAYILYSLYLPYATTWAIPHWITTLVAFVIGGIVAFRLLRIPPATLVEGSALGVTAVR
jgi:hypothetical protein